MKDRKTSWKIIIFIVIFLLMWLIYHNKELIIPLLEKSPFLWSLYSFVKVQIEQRSLLGLAALSFFGSLFFVFIPVDLILVYYLYLGYNKILVFSIAMTFVMLGLILDYVLGFLLGKKIFSKKAGPEKMQKRIEKFGSFTIILGYMLFFPMQFITAALGAFKYPFKKFLFLTFIMLSLKFLFILITGSYFIMEILPRIQAFF